MPIEHTSNIVRGRVWHHRIAPTPHSFEYPLAYLAIPLLNSLDATRLWPLLGESWSNLLSINPSDHLKCFAQENIDSSLAQRVKEAFAQSGILCQAGNIVWLTLPRLWGYTFEPVSFFLLFDSSQELHGLICEVNNTFSETHCYVAYPTLVSAHESHFSFPKSFYVSPFLSQSGTYHICVEHREKTLSLKISLEQDGATVFEAGFEGTSCKLNRKSLLRTLAHITLGPWMVSPRIALHAMILFFRKKIEVVPKTWPKPPENGRPGMFSIVRYIIISLWCRIQKHDYFIRKKDSLGAQQ
jgi:DUF1365 family protein